MKLYQDDVEALAKARVYRDGHALTQKFMVLAMACMIAGAGIAYFVNQVIGACVLGMGVALYFWRTDALDKKAKFAARKLVSEWQAENKEAR